MIYENQEKALTPVIIFVFDTFFKNISWHLITNINIKEKISIFSRQTAEYILDEWLQRLSGYKP